ncbi:MAG: phenylalanine--tRNA ligase subunit beta, partial [Defluviitaleaceae bacterium]|nr:phenylalanine--tRNA ligase subunit beta [Defluviitaleaceae bacterium]
MNIPLSWLGDFVDISDIDTKRFVDGMTASGTKVESVHSMGAQLQNIVVGKVISAKPHPSSDKLRVFGVDVGEGALLTIVAGAANVMEGDVVPVAKSGATIGEGKQISTGEIRGVQSQGMMCSIEELGFSRQDYPEAPEYGIYVFSQPHPLGADVVQILRMCEDVIEFEITSNRVDCFSVIGIAREAAATFERKFDDMCPMPKEEGNGETSANISVEIANSKGCPRYVARVVTDVTIGPSPLWLRNRLTMAGIRPINNMVDITNYVNLELGQPLHAFDIDHVDGRHIIVRNAEQGEQFVTLDGQSRVLDSSMLVIADRNKALAIAGIMGGENSKISEGAHTVLLESACFEGAMIRAGSAKLGLRTEASAKFEKGLDPNLAMLAANRAAQLIEELSCGKVLKGVVDVFPGAAGQSAKTVAYSAQRVSRLINVPLSDAQIEAYLARLGISAANGVAIIPTFRQDLNIEADIAEEAARLYGYDRIPIERAEGLSASAPSSLTAGKKTPKQLGEDTLREMLASYGLFQALNFSFESPGVFDSLLIPQGHKLRDAIRIKNPLGEEYSIMRTQSVAAMLQSLSLNYNRRNPSAWLYEIGRTYTPREGAGLPCETEVLTIGMYGGGADFFAVKGIAEGLIARVCGADVQVVACTDVSFLHTGRAAKLLVEGLDIGFMGELHPEAADNFEINERVYIAVLDLTAIFSMLRPVKKYRPLPKFPGIGRDIAFVVANDITAAQMRDVIVFAAGEFLESAGIFDIYKGEQVGQGMVSVAFRLYFRAT